MTLRPLTHIAAPVAPAEFRAPAGDGRAFALCALLLVLAAYLGLLACAAARVVADGYDGAGFVLALETFDLTRFQPHPPGYPLLVLLARGLHAAGLAPGLAVAAVSALGLGAGLAALACALRRVSVSGGWLALLFLPALPLVLCLGTATLSDGAGLGLLLAAAAWLACFPGARAGQLGAGALLGLALGVRPAYAPLLALGLLVLAVCWGRPGLRAVVRTGLAAAVATLGWLVPLALVVGPRALWRLSTAHAQGHFEDFGGSALSDRSPGARLLSLASGLLQSTVGEALPLLAGLLAVALVLVPPARWPRPARRLGRGLCALALLVALWTLLALPVRGHGRHLLPLVVLLGALVALALGVALDALLAQRRRAGLLLLLGCALLLGLCSVRGARTAWHFRSQPSPGAALALHVAGTHPRGTLLYGARAARYLDILWGSGSARPALYFGEVLGDLERRSHLPAEILVTSEVRASASTHARLRPLARFCYDPALPRVLRFDPLAAGPLDAGLPDGCVELRAYTVKP